ncbi:hypothetical protein GCM10020216_030920 [Nonomuraea helvata]
MATLLEITEYGEELGLEQLWEAIDAIVPRRELKEAVAAVTGMAPSPGACRVQAGTPHADPPAGRLLGEPDPADRLRVGGAGPRLVDPARPRPLGAVVLA